MLAPFGPLLLKILLASATISVAIVLTGRATGPLPASDSAALALVLGPPAVVALLLARRDRDTPV